jgi:hypothetical protein
MRHFIYTYSEHTPRNGHTVKTVRVWRIVRNAPRFVGEMSDTFVDQNQLVMQLLQTAGALPKHCFERRENGSSKHVPWSLKEAGIATITQL